MISKLRRNSTAIGIFAALMMISGFASAAEHEPAEDDTLLVVGFDSVNGILVTGISDALAGAWDCSVPESGDPDDPALFDATYGYPDSEDTTQTVETLVQQGDPHPIEVLFDPNPDAEDQPGDSLEYGPDNECTLTSVAVAGKNGQVNHGKIVSAFARLLKGYDTRRGCLMRLVAHTDYGKGGQQVKTSDVEQQIVPGIAEAGELSLANMPTTCQKGNKAPKENKGQLKKAERLAANGAPGNSGKAKGHDKDD